ncbi:hypothetical protein Tco_1325538, partial [Tanacetum coccineum]
MAGTGTTDRGKEALGMMALHETLRNLCINTDWTYSVFWTIRPRPRLRGGNGCKVGDDNGSFTQLIYMKHVSKPIYGDLLSRSRTL